ncbi:glycosyltransferase family 4 protein [Citrobacter freundii]|nr:glycosyltransferase family 4 protein [Citrobacter freundii]EJH9546956.1 glycosyltransferase family 4 protein [Citrobacter freundii]EKW5685883.1 glycosyltransferase family 4 protein [Citrobacter freundii]EKX5705343.1 glycosyltransferase family 4 protein [Citrobacter freundii]EKX9687730.1 glycosyltransferase family 4 protein [Citrobacter freundii]
MMAKKLKVLHVQLLPLLSGVQRVTLNEITALSNEFNYSLVCSTNGPLTQALSDYKVNIFYVNELCREISAIKDFRAIIKLYKLIKKEKYDVVHTHSSKTGVLGRLAAKLAGVTQVIHTVHGFSFPAASSKKQYAVYFSMEWIAKFFTDNLIVLNKDDYDIAINKLRYSPAKVHLIANGIDVTKFVPVTKKRISNKLKVIMVGRLSEQKDPHTLLKAMKEVMKVNSNVTLTYVGDGELRAQLEQESFDFKENIFFHGWSNDIAKLLSEHDLFVLPSLWEGMPLAILEALSCGLPCIVSDIPGNKNLVVNGYNGRLFEPKNHIQLAEIIKLYANEYDDYHRQSVNAREFVVDNYTLERRNKMVKYLYSKI